ncbi:MAG: hypothetical protein KAY37_04310 [Phycisphaerae bacterium]|nr:hypothetical protein [Phycisphaerae bacterium]
MSPDSNTIELFEPLRAVLSQAPETERFRLLASFFVDLADRPLAAADGVEPSQAELLAKKLTRVSEEKALLADTLAAAQADLERGTKQLEAEQQRAEELDRINADQRKRLKSAQDQIAELEGQVVAKNGQLHKAESRVEELAIKLQRAELAAGDTTRVDTLEEAKRSLGTEVEQTRGNMEQLRLEKDAVIEQLKADVLTAKSSSSAGAGSALAVLWDRLARSKPPLAPGGLTPPIQAAERLVDTFIELTRFVQDLDQALAPFLGGFAKHNPAVARPWDVYARSPELQRVIKEIIDAEHGKPAGVVKMRLLGLKRWTLAATIAGDSAIESIAHELEEQMRGELGMGSDPNRKIKDYIRDDGQELFHQHIRELRSQKLADAYAHGV